MSISCADVCDAVIKVLERAGIHAPNTDDYGSSEHSFLIHALYQATITFTPEETAYLNDRSEAINLANATQAKV